MPGHNKPVSMSGHELLQVARFRLMAEEQLERLGRAIRRRRAALGLSIPQLAAKLPVDPKTIERWELARTGGAMDNLGQIAQALETTTDALLADSIKPRERKSSPGEWPTVEGVPGLEDFLKHLDDEISALREDVQTLLSRSEAAEIEELEDDERRDSGQATTPKSDTPAEGTAEGAAD